jgi:hypothetical protein
MVLCQRPAGDGEAIAMQVAAVESSRRPRPTATTTLASPSAVSDRTTVVSPSAPANPCADRKSASSGSGTDPSAIRSA